jgi:outer membrane protein OmpA-like peptidoglycan-associated protein
VISHWTSYRDFRFQSNQAELMASDTRKVAEIATYLKANPSLNAGIDGSMEPRNQQLSDRRTDTVREALIEAGVSGSRIQEGAFANSKQPHDGRVLVMIRTAMN